MTYSPLKTGALLMVNALGSQPVGYSIVPLPGEQVIQTYIDGGSSRVYPFAFQSVESTADDLERIENSDFYENFAAWLDAQTLVDTLPNLGTGKTSIAIRATGWGYLFQQGVPETGVYQIQCQLFYDQTP
jgi:hypothetical protein